MEKNSTNRFDAVRMNYEGPWNLGEPASKKAYEPVSSGDIEYFTSVKEKIHDNPKSNTIPAWIKNNAKWWAEGTIDNNSFVTSIQWLIQNGIIEIESNNVEPLPVYASISWMALGSKLASIPDPPIEYKGMKKQTFEHLLDGVDKQPGTGSKLLQPENDIVDRTSPIITYARQNLKKVWITIETG